MWIFTEDGFFSAVNKGGDADTICVRARCRQDLENLLTRLDRDFGLIQESPANDYPLRVFLERSEWIAYVTDCSRNLDYQNFKAHAIPHGDYARKTAYHDVWHTMHRLENPRRSPARGWRRSRR